MAKNSFDFEAHLSRHPHNVSAGYTSSLTTGPIVPQYFDVLGPGDTMYFTPKCFARLQDIVAPFFGEVSLHFDAFFVPMQMMYTLFGQVFGITNDVISSFYTRDTANLPSRFPLLRTSWANGQDLRGHYLGHKECFGKETMRLLDALDCNALSVLSPDNYEGSDTPSGTPSISAINTIPKAVSPWLFCAYQAIYQKYYRNDDIERFDIDSYNIDRFYLATTIANCFEQDRLFRLRYVQRPDDYFTSVKVSPLASAVNSVSAQIGTDSPDGNYPRFPKDGGKLSDIFVKVNDYLGFVPGDYSFESKSASNTNIYPNNDDRNFDVESSAFGASSVGHDVSWYPSAANIRALFAVDKFTRIYGRAGKTYDEQILAHFGVKIPHDVKHDLTHIKSWSMSLAAEPVYSTADIEGGSSLGQVGGQANNTLQAKQEKFTAPVHGVFMIVAYARTKPRYFMTFNKLNLLMERLDFPIPEFDKLGMQPQYLYESYPQFLLPNEPDDPSPMAVRVGWQRRYQQFKQKYNRVSPLYYNTNLLDDIRTESNAFSPYVLSRLSISQKTILDNTNWMNYESSLVPAVELFEQPDALDGVMAVAFAPNWSNDYWAAPQSVFDTDPIILDFYCDAKKVSWMSETGEPDL